MGYQWNSKATRSNFNCTAGKYDMIGGAEGDYVTADYKNPDQLTVTARHNHVVAQGIADTDSARLVVRLQKTSPTNSFLRRISNLQAKTGVIYWGTFTVSDPLGANEFMTLTNAVLATRPGGAISDDQPVLEWAFEGTLTIIQLLPVGMPFGVTPPHPPIA